MLNKLIWNDVRQNKLLSAATVFFMAVSAMMLALTALLFSGLLGSVDALMEQAQVPDLLQMHTGELSEAEIARFAGECPEIGQWQICRFLNLDNSEAALGGHSLLDSTQDNGLCAQSEGFDFLLDMDNNRRPVLPGQVYVPVCYRSRYGLRVGDVLDIGGETLTIAGFLRDAQMNSMMASSKRFLRRMGFVFQQMNMMANLNLLDNILLPAVHANRGRGRGRSAKEELNRRARALMKKLGIAGLEKRSISQVSGGQLQRSCICRSMMNEPEILFADEPTGALNKSAAAEVMEELVKLNREGTTILMVTHDSKVASRCDRIMYLLDGRISAELALGKSAAVAEKRREETVAKWLMEMGW